MPPKKKRTLSEELVADDAEVTNKDILGAISQLTNRMSEFGNTIMFEPWNQKLRMHCPPVQSP